MPRVAGKYTKGVVKPKGGLLAKKPPAEDDEPNKFNSLTRALKARKAKKRFGSY
jgi:hypothetical protein